MPKKTLAAALAAIVLLPLLVFVELPEAEAHTKTVKRCAFDPFAGQQCWTEKVSHSHEPPPDIAPYLPSNTTPTTAPPTTAPPITQPPPCPAEQHRHGSSGCHSHPPPTTVAPTTTTTTTPPTTTTTTVTTTTQPPPTTATAPPDCPKSGRPRNVQSRHRHVMGAHRNRGGGTMSACHWYEKSHCPGGQHEHVHGSLECHNLGSPVENASGTHSGWVDHCADGYHSHEHTGSCHAADPPYYDGVEVKKTEIAYGYICVTTNTKPHGEVKTCTRIPEEDSAADELLDWAEDVGIDYAALAACAATGPLALKCGAIVIGAVAVTELLEIFCVPGFCDKEDPPPVVGNNQKTPPTTTTTTTPPTPTTPPPSTTTTTETPKGVTWDDIFKKRDEWRAGKATQDEVDALVDQWLCQQGVTENCQ